ncbi:MAG: lysylphosphatidylglycerol synthase transmembrane domain-containing protein, partial [Clostridia bacterium]|nr:lysylphosphatidylglycerol synthase transmembrane domain-containing protein [Clostridia bacterium]
MKKSPHMLTMFIMSTETRENNSAEDVSLDLQVEKVKHKAAKKTRIRKSIVYSVFILLNVLVILVVLLLENKSGNVIAGKEVLRTAGENFPYTAIVFAIFFVQVAADTVSLYFLLKQSGKKDFVLSLRTSIIGKYYDKLTPWSTGGQPLQMAYMSSHGVDVPTACAIPLAKSLIKVITVGAAVLPVFIFSGIRVNVYAMVAAYISVCCGALIPVLMIVFVRHPEWGQRFTRWLIRLLCRMKIVKDYDALYAKFSVLVDNFLKGMGYLSTHRKMLLIVGLMTLIDVAAINTIPYFIMKAFGYPNVDFWYIFVLCLFVSYASYFAPSPGAAGVA